MNIINLKTQDLVPYLRNQKKHDEKQIGNVAESIKQFGIVQPIVVDKDNNVIIGHCRLLACQKLKIEEVPVVKLEELTPEQANKLRLLDNKLNESDWDFDILTEDIPELDFTGFDIDWELPESITEETKEEEKEVVEDEAPEVTDENTYNVKPGDVFKLGEHRIICGDSTDPEVIKKLMNGEKADLFLTDPPYNVNYTDGHDTERKIMNDHFDTDEECGKKLWKPAFTNALNNSNDCCAVYCFMPQGGTHMMMMMMMMKEAGWQVKHELIWRKQSIVLNRADYNYQHEPFLYGWNKTHKFYGNGKFKNTSVWDFDRPTKSKEHPTMKPVALFGEILMNATKENDNVLDLFGGSGTTLIACEQLNRKCFMCELDTKYVNVIIKRWETLTGKKAEKLAENSKEKGD